MGHSTIKAPVVILDYENPRNVLVRRAHVVNSPEVRVWSTDAEVPPPKLDKVEGLEMLKTLCEGLPGVLIIIDTLRSAHSRDENATQYMQEVMETAKRLRMYGATVLLLHHTVKGDDTKFIGSVAILNQSDHVAALYPTRRGSEKETEDDDPHDTEGQVYCFRTVQKTRFDHFKMWVSFNTETFMFEPSPDPDEEHIVKLHEIMTGMEKAGAFISQKAMIEAAASCDISKGKARSLLQRGEGKYWEHHQDKSRRGAYIYTPRSSVPAFSPLGAESWKAESQHSEVQQNAGKNVDAEVAQPTMLADVSSFPDDKRNAGKVTGIATEPAEREFDLSDCDPDALEWG